MQQVFTVLICPGRGGGISTLAGGTYPGGCNTYPSGGTYPGQGGTYPGQGSTYPGWGDRCPEGNLNVVVLGSMLPWECEQTL